MLREIAGLELLLLGEFTKYAQINERSKLQYQRKSSRLLWPNISQQQLFYENRFTDIEERKTMDQSNCDLRAETSGSGWGLLI